MRSEFAKWEIKTSVFSGRKSQAGNCWAEIKMPRPSEDRSNVGWAGQFNNIGPVPLSPQEASRN